MPYVNGQWQSGAPGWWHKTPNPGIPQTTPSPAAWQFVHKPPGGGDGQGGGAGGSGDLDYMRALLGFAQSRPGVPNYPMPQMPGGLDMPTLGPNPPLGMPGQLNMPNLPAPASLNTPELTVPNLPTPEPLGMPGQLNMPTLTNPALVPPGQVGLPEMRPGVSLGELAGAVSPYQAPDLQGLFGQVAPPPPIQQNFGPAAGPGPQSVASAPGNISTGIGAIPTPPPPTAQAFGPVEGMGAGAQAAMRANQAAALPSVNTQLGLQHAGTAAQFLQNLQGAQSGAGLGWGRLGEEAQAVQRNAALGRMGNTFNFLQGMMG